MPSNNSDLRGGEEMVEITRATSGGKVETGAGPLAASMIFPICRRYKKMWCSIYVRGIKISHCSFKDGSYHKLPSLKRLEVGEALRRRQDAVAGMQPIDSWGD